MNLDDPDNLCYNYSKLSLEVKDCLQLKGVQFIEKEKVVYMQSTNEKTKYTWQLEEGLEGLVQLVEKNRINGLLKDEFYGLTLFMRSSISWVLAFDKVPNKTEPYIVEWLTENGYSFSRRKWLHPEKNTNEKKKQKMNKSFFLFLILLLSENNKTKRF